MEKKQVAPGIDFEDASQLKAGTSAVRWGKAKYTVSPTGACRSNTQGKLLTLDFVKRMGGDPNNFQLTYKGAEAAGLMGLYLTKTGDKGVMGITQYSNAVAFHAGTCFEEFPGLRPGFKVDCFVEETVDAKGNPCLAIHTLAGSPTRTVKRKKKGKKPEQKPDPNPDPNAGGDSGTDGEDTQA